MACHVRTRCACQDLLYLSGPANGRSMAYPDLVSGLLVVCPDLSVGGQACQGFPVVCQELSPACRWLVIDLSGRLCCQLHLSADLSGPVGGLSGRVNDLSVACQDLSAACRWPVSALSGLFCCQLHLSVGLAGPASGPPGPVSGLSRAWQG